MAVFLVLVGSFEFPCLKDCFCFPVFVGDFYCRFGYEEIYVVFG